MRGQPCDGGGEVINERAVLRYFLKGSDVAVLLGRDFAAPAPSLRAAFAVVHRGRQRGHVHGHGTGAWRRSHHRDAAPMQPIPTAVFVNSNEMRICAAWHLVRG